MTSGLWATARPIQRRGPLSRSGTLTEHWDGSQWSIVPSPNPGNLGNSLWAVTALSHDNVWAVGIYQANPGGFQPLFEHWTGTNWDTEANHGEGEGLSAVSALT